MCLLILGVICLECNGNWLPWVSGGCTCHVSVFVNHISWLARLCENHKPPQSPDTDCHYNATNDIHTHLNKLWTIPLSISLFCTIPPCHGEKCFHIMCLHVYLKKFMDHQVSSSHHHHECLSSLREGTYHWQHVNRISQSFKRLDVALFDGTVQLVFFSKHHEHQKGWIHAVRFWPWQ